MSDAIHLFFTEYKRRLIMSGCNGVGDCYRRMFLASRSDMQSLIPFMASSILARLSLIVAAMISTGDRKQHSIALSVLDKF